MIKCDCDKWKEVTKYIHHNETGRATFMNSFKFCPWCKSPLFWGESPKQKEVKKEMNNV